MKGLNVLESDGVDKASHRRRDHGDDHDDGQSL
ncbi:MAG: hypothetical protein RLZZ73_209 [Actinomycetota bacterium]